VSLTKGKKAVKG
jgi:hypothetical protein